MALSSWTITKHQNYEDFQNIMDVQLHPCDIYSMLTPALPICLAADLCSVGTNCLVAPSVKLSAADSRAFPVVGPTDLERPVG